MSTPRPARLTAAASREKSAATLPDLTFDFRPGSPVLGPPGRVLLRGPCPGEFGLVTADRDGPPGRRSGAVPGQRAAGTHGAEGRRTAAGSGRADGHARPRRAGHGPGYGIDSEAILSEPASRCHRGLDLDHHLHAGLLQIRQQRTGTVGGIAVDCQRLRPTAAGSLSGIGVSMIIATSLDCSTSLGCGIGLRGQGHQVRGEQVLRRFRRHRCSRR